MILEGTYFHHNSCAIREEPFFYEYIKEENYKFIKDVSIYLKNLGLNPKAFTAYGHKDVIRALLEV
ncbi:MAG: hypothetical protein LBT18_01975 [Endomicrobium sp.]|nr:hypothetical protein [Endomicrobium sp.]